MLSSLFANNTVLGTMCEEEKNNNKTNMSITQKLKLGLKKEEKNCSKAALFINSVNCIIPIYKVHFFP